MSESERERERAKERKKERERERAHKRRLKSALIRRNGILRFHAPLPFVAEEISFIKLTSAKLAPRQICISIS